MAFTPEDGDALIIVDMQNDFCEGGALAVAGGDALVPDINALARRFGTVVMTQDWHPAGHSSFASSHPGRAPFEQIEMPYGAQTLWPDHCVQGSEGAAFHPGLDIPAARMILR
ncbi:MAG: isochorismatase family protein, partial [Pseudomonadota bacterium]